MRETPLKHEHELVHTAAKTRNESVFAVGHVQVKYMADPLPV